MFIVHNILQLYLAVPLLSVFKAPAALARMGAENSVLEGCEWGEEVLSAGLDWDLQHALSKDGRLITVFQPRKNERKYNDMIQQLAKVKYARLILVGLFMILVI